MLAPQNSPAGGQTVHPVNPPRVPPPSLSAGGRRPCPGYIPRSNTQPATQPRTQPLSNRNITQLEEQLRQTFQEQKASCQLDMALESLDCSNVAENYGVHISVQLPGDEKPVSVVPAAANLSTEDLKRYKAAAAEMLNKLKDRASKKNYQQQTNTLKQSIISAASQAGYQYNWENLWNRVAREPLNYSCVIDGMQIKISKSEPSTPPVPPVPPQPVGGQPRLLVRTQQPGQGPEGWPPKPDHSDSDNQESDEDEEST